MGQLDSSPAPATKAKTTIFFGWWTLLATSILNIIGQALYSYGFSAFFKPISTELNFSRTVTSTAAGIGRLEGGLEAPISGWLVDKFGPKWVIFGGVAVVGAGLLLMNLVHSVWTYYAVWGVTIGTGINLSMTIPIDKTLTNWFVKKRGLAMGIKFACIGLGGVIIMPVLTWLIENYGWRTTSTIWAVMMFASLLLILFFIRQKRPEHYGLLPDGARPETSGDRTDMVAKGIQYASTYQESEFTFRQALKTSAFWILLVAYSCQFLGTNAVNVHIIPFLTDQGIGSMVAAGMASLMFFFTIPSRLLGGMLADRLAKRYLPYLMAVAFGLQALGTGALLAWPGIPSIYAFLLLFGAGSGASPILGVLIRGRFFGRKAYGSISGLATFLMAPIGVAAPIYAGWVYDSTQSYMAAFTTFTALAAVATLLVCFVRPPQAPGKA